MKLTSCLCLCALLAQAAAAPTFANAVADYRAERFDAAWQGFVAVQEGFTEGRPLPPELLGNLALAALRRQRAGDAEASARALLQHADLGERALGEFLLGSAAMQRAEVAAAAAQLADAEPMAWQAAIDSAQRALGHWCRAAQHGQVAGEPDAGWDQALRNAERAWHTLARWREQRDASSPTKKQEQPPPPPPTPAGDNPLEDANPDLRIAPLSPREVAALAQKLLRKEREKRSARTAAQRQQAVVGERDW